MTKNLYKVQKQIKKKRGGQLNALHEDSRDAKRLRRASAREDRLARVATEVSKARQGYCTYPRRNASWMCQTRCGGTG